MASFERVSALSDETEIANKAVALGLIRSCACDWKDCRQLQVFFTEAKDDDYGGPCIGLSTGNVKKLSKNDNNDDIEKNNNSGKYMSEDNAVNNENEENDCYAGNKNNFEGAETPCNEKQKNNADKNNQWRNGIATNIGAVIRSNQRRVYVAKHHFDRRQISLRNSGKLLSTPLSRAILEKCAHVVDLRYFVTDKRSNKPKYFNLPNHPRCNVLKDMRSINSSRSSRAERLHDGRVNLEEQRQLEAFENLTFEDWSKFQRVAAQKDREQVEQIADLRKQLSSKSTELDEQRRIVHNIKRGRRRRGTTADGPQLPNPITPEHAQKLDRETMDFIESKIGPFLSVAVGGLSRMTLLSRLWHERNPDAANTFFGFATFDEMLVYVKALFPDVDISCCEQTCHIANDGTLKLDHYHLTSLEQCISAKMYMHSLPFRAIVARIFGRSDARMGRIIKEWAPRWGKAGEFLSILPMPEWYFDKELPDEYIERNLEKVAALLDGKDFLMHCKRKDDFMRRIQHSNKMKAAAARGIAWTTGAGLSFEHTKLFGARVPETRLVQLWGSQGVAATGPVPWILAMKSHP